MQLQRVRDERRQCSACGLWVMDSIAVYLPYHHLGFHLCLGDFHTLYAALEGMRKVLSDEEREDED